jgi:putative acetyltransferase
MEPGTTVTVRLLRDDELATYLEIHASAVRGLAAGHYPPEVIAGWVVPVTGDTIRGLTENADGEIRLLAEIDGVPVGMGALVPGKSELRACYVAAHAARRGCGTALVREMERIAREHGGGAGWNSPPR